MNYIFQIGFYTMDMSKSIKKIFNNMKLNNYYINNINCI